SSRAAVSPATPAPMTRTSGGALMMSPRNRELRDGRSGEAGATHVLPGRSFPVTLRDPAPPRSAPASRGPDLVRRPSSDRSADRGRELGQRREEGPQLLHDASRIEAPEPSHLIGHLGQ